MNFFLHVKYGDGIAIATILQKEGYKVTVFIETPHYKRLHDGLLTKIEDLNDWLNKITKKDIVIFDSVSNGELADGLRAKGIMVYGAGKFQDKLELDRAFGMQYMVDNGINIPITMQFDNKKDLLAFVNSPDINMAKRWVYKPDDNEATSMTYVSEGVDDLKCFIEKKASDNACILQEFIKGLELSTEVWFGNGIPNLISNNTIETKKAWAGDLGCNTGCQSSVQWCHSSLNSKSVRDGIGRCFEDLRKRKITGCLDLNGIIAEDGKLYGLEWTARFGYSALYALLELLHTDKEKLGELITWHAEGRDGGAMPMRNEYGMNVRVSIPPYPLESNGQNDYAVHELFKATEGQEIEIGDDKCSYTFIDVKLGEKGLETCGVDCIVVEVGTHDKDLEKGAERIYNALKKLKLENKQYRIDGFDRAIEQIKDLRRMGYEVI